MNGSDDSNRAKCQMNITNVQDSHLQEDTKTLFRVREKILEDR